jgi:Tfp pilus assembly pilus retraction ATPase PilT
MTKNKGSFTLEESLVQLVNRGFVEREDAQIHAIHPDDLSSLMKG